MTFAPAKDTGGGQLYRPRDIAPDNVDRKRRSNGGDRPRFPLARFDSIKPDDGANYLIKGLLPSTGLAVVWGAPKCGKSFWAFDALMHVALGWQYRGHRVKSGAVVYCALEGAQGFKTRIEAFRIAKLAESEPTDPPFFLMSSPLSLIADAGRFIEDIRAQLGDARPVAVCIDTLNRSITGSENDDEAMGAYVRAADAIRAAFDCLVTVVHHSGHGADRPRGHSSLGGALDIQIGVRRDASDNVVAELELAKDGAVGLAFVSRLVVVVIGHDADGDPITSCVIEPVGESAAKASEKKPPRLPKSAQTAFRALTTALAEGGEDAPPSNHVPAGARVVTLDVWRTYALKMGICTSDEGRAQRKAFQSATEVLTAARLIGIWQPHAWIISDH